MLLEFKQVKKTYGKVTVLDLPSLSVSKGECVGIVGNNGAGKTTAFSLILDLIKASKGEVLSKGISTSDSEQWKKYTSAYIDETFLIDFLTPDEYFDFVAGLHAWTKGDLSAFLEQFIDFFNEEVIGQKKYLRDLSKGNQKKVGIIGALIGDPEIVILDEPFASLDPSTQNRLKTIIKSRLDKHTFLISSHDLTHVTDVCNRFVILEKGKLIMDNPKTDETIKQMNDYFEV